MSNLLLDSEVEGALLLFEKMATSRLIDSKSAKLAKQNKGGTFHLSANGHEMIGALAALHLSVGKDFAFPYYRDRAFAIAFGVAPVDLFASFLAKRGTHHSGGRMMPDHFCDTKRRILCQSSVVGSQFLQAVGVAKSIQLMDKDEVVYVSGGDGATSQGDFHEALNFATIHKLPVVFVIQDNGWAISVPLEEQTSGKSIAKMASGYANLTIDEVDGGDWVACSALLDKSIQRARKKEGPSLIVAKVPRMAPHSSSDDHLRYREEQELAEVASQDPLSRIENYLFTHGVTKEKIAEKYRFLEEEIREAAEEAERLPNPVIEEAALYKPFAVEEKVYAGEGEGVVMVDAICQGLHEALARDQSVLLFGQDVAGGKGGVFRATHGLTDRFGCRCFNTPLAESTIVGLAIGMSMAYHKPIAEIQFADYFWTAANQLFNELATLYFRSNSQQSASVVIRIPTGGYIQGGPYHSQNIEGFLAHQPGLKVVYPSNAEDAKRLLHAAIQEPNPVVILEHKALYRQRLFSARAEPKAEEILPLGKGKLVIKGGGATVVTWGMMTVMTAELAQRKRLDIDCIDLRTIVPWDQEMVFTSVKKTGKLLIIQEAQKSGGFAGEIAATVAEELFDYLDAPIRRLAALDLPVAYAKGLEEATLPKSLDIEKAIIDLINY